MWAGWVSKCRGVYWFAESGAMVVVEGVCLLVTANMVVVCELGKV